MATLKITNQRNGLTALTIRDVERTTAEQFLNIDATEQPDPLPDALAALETRIMARLAAIEGKIGASAQPAPTEPQTPADPVPPVVLRIPPPAAGKRILFVPPAEWTGLRSDVECLALIRPTTWEPRLSNEAANTTRPVAGVDYEKLEPWDRAHGWDDRARALYEGVSGNAPAQLTNTDMLAQFYAAKYGADEDDVRAWMHKESAWDALALGDYEDRLTYKRRDTVSFKRLLTIYPEPRIPTSFGILQIKDIYAYRSHPASLMPSFCLDYTLARWRAVVNGWFTWLNTTYGQPQTADDAMAAWKASDWTGATAQSYLSDLKQIRTERRWENKAAFGGAEGRWA